MESEFIIKNLSPISNWKNGNFNFSAADTLVQLPEVSSPKINEFGANKIKFIRILAKSTNTGIIYIGSENLSKLNASIELKKSQSVSLDIADLSLLYFIADTINDNIGYSIVYS